VSLDEEAKAALEGTAEPATPTLGSRLFVGLQHHLPQHLMSRTMHALAASELPPLRRLLIRSFLSGFHPDMSEAEQPDPGRYRSFNAFFTRALTPGARPIDLDPAVLISPVDGRVSEIGRIVEGTLLQAKGRTYTAAALLDSASWAQRFADGSFVTIYLAPSDYHRIHAPLASTLRAAWHTPGCLFSVNGVTAAAVPQLFARNERVSCMLEESTDGSAPDAAAAPTPTVLALVLVGALMVGSIETVWHGQITPRRARSPAELPLTVERSPLTLAKGAELGRFNMGSTVILLLPPGVVEWLPGLAPGSRVRMGQMLGRLTRARPGGS
jgi:phosphatidylserine decarboxylase